MIVWLTVKQYCRYSRVSSVFLLCEDVGFNAETWHLLCSYETCLMLLKCKVSYSDETSLLLVS